MPDRPAGGVADPLRRRCTRLMSGLGLLLAVAGCSSVVRVQPLATSRVEVAAYNLRGPSLDALRHEAARLCVNGGEVLRQSQSGSRRAATDGPQSRWASSAMDWVDPPQGEAQMMVVCRAQAADRAIAPAPVPAAPAAPPLASVAPASASADEADRDSDQDPDPAASRLPPARRVPTY